MTRRVCVLLVCALGPLGAVTGCGGGGSANTTKTGATSGLSLETVKRLNKTNSAKTLASCKQAANNPGLPASVKPLIDTQCEYIRTGNNAGLHAVSRQICEAEAALEQEPARSRMQAQCKQL